jgi:hypothetical protein
MEDQGPINLPYLWLWVSWWGASVAYFQQRKDLGPRGFNWWTFLIELLTSGFVGFVTFNLCQSRGVDEKMTSVLVAIAGHMGTRAIFLIRDRLGFNKNEHTGGGSE